MDETRDHLLWPSRKGKGVHHKEYLRRSTSNRYERRRARRRRTVHRVHDAGRRPPCLRCRRRSGGHVGRRGRRTRVFAGDCPTITSDNRSSRYSRRPRNRRSRGLVAFRRGVAGRRRSGRPVLGTRTGSVRRDRRVGIHRRGPLRRLVILRVVWAKVAC